MSTATSVPFMVFQITLALGQLMWKQSAVNCLLQNKPVKIVISGSNAAALGQALKLQWPSITWEFCPVSVIVVVILLTVLNMAVGQPLVDVLNTAFNRGYQVRVRYKRHGTGAMDDELIFEMLP